MYHRLWLDCKVVVVYRRMDWEIVVVVVVVYHRISLD